jgi:hypothetical protein
LGNRIIEGESAARQEGRGAKEYRQYTQERERDKSIGAGEDHGEVVPAEKLAVDEAIELEGEGGAEDKHGDVGGAELLLPTNELHIFADILVVEA